MRLRAYVVMQLWRVMGRFVDESVLCGNFVSNATIKSFLPQREAVMDPVSTAILAVLPALAADVVKSGVRDAYEGLKTVIRRKWSDSAAITKAISAIEEDPTSKAQAAVLEEKVAAAKAADDMEVAQALHQLVEQMKAHGIGGEAVARIQFNMSGGIVQGVAGAENVQIGSMNFGVPPKG